MLLLVKPGVVLFSAFMTFVSIPGGHRGCFDFIPTFTVALINLRPMRTKNLCKP